MLLCLVLLLSGCLIVNSGFAADSVPLNGQPEATVAEVAYGPHLRNVLNFWQAEGDGPRPLLVYIHGGAWWTGDKGQKGPAIQPFLDQHCMDCHDRDVKKGDLDLSSLSTDGDDAAALKKWVRVFDRVAALQQQQLNALQVSYCHQQALC